MKKAKIDKYNQSPFLIMRAAYQYYIQDRSQNEIADDLDISVTTVSRLLAKAKEDRIVEFVIRDPFLKCIDVGKKIRDEYHLKDVIIAPNGITEDINEVDDSAEDNAKKLVALEGARYLQRIITPDDILGVTWGSTVYQMINFLNPSQKVDAKFVTLHGSIAAVETDLDVRTLVSRMARAFFGENYYLLTDALMSCKEAVDIIKNERNNKTVFKMFDQITVSVNGVGSLYPEEASVLASPEFMDPEDLKELEKAGVYGDIALRFFDKDGKECDTSLRDRMIAIGFDQFKKIPTKITLASGVQKASTIRAALRGGLIDVLIIDYQLAEALLSD